MKDNTTVNSPRELIIKYGDNKQITLGPDDAAEILAIYARQRKTNGTVLTEPKIEDTAKPNLLRRIDNTVTGFIAKLLK